MPSLILPTGTPRFTAYDLSSTLTMTFHPTFDEYLDGFAVDETVWKEMESGRIEPGTTIRERLGFEFGWRFIEDEEAMGLLTILRPRLTFFVPRTLAPGDPLGAEETEYLCRVDSDIPLTKHLTRGYFYRNIELTVIEDYESGTPT